MKQTKSTVFYSHANGGIGKFLCLLIMCLLSISAQAAVVTTTLTLDGIQLTISYNNVVCINSNNTITYTLENTNTIPFNSNIIVEGFTPDGTQPSSAGLAFVSSVPPQPSAVVSYDPTSATFECPQCDFTGTCPDPSVVNPGIGHYVASVPGTPLLQGIPYTWTITYQATACGPQTYYGQLLEGDFNPTNHCYHMCNCFAISIVVVPYATLINEFIPFFVCSNSTGFIGQLPAPECPTDCTGPLEPCAGTGPTGSFPYHYTVSGVTGGTVQLIDATGGIFEFSPAPNFQGTGIFDYNVISDTSPSAFCSAPTPGQISFPVVLPPTVTGSASFSGCTNSTITGNLNTYVTGGSQFYFFQDNGPASCGTVSIAGNGIFTFTAPTGPGICTFPFSATDIITACTNSGSVSVNVFAGPSAVPQTLSTCINQPVSGTLTSTGGTAPITFSVSTPPANGILTGFDPNTGLFLYTPNAGFTGTDTFQYIVTDSRGCFSVPATVTINVNSQPVTSSTSSIGCENTVIFGSLTGLVSGGTGTQVFSVSGPSSQLCGVLQVLDNGSFVFSPNNLFTGTCSFDYTLTQGGCPSTGPATITFDVESALIATGAIFNTCQFGNVTGNLLNYLLNSSTGTVSFTAVGAPLNGSLTLNPAGPFSFTASISSGTAGFNYQALSDVLPCPSAVETITVNVHANPITTTGTKAVCSGTGTAGTLAPLVSGTPPLSFSGPITSVNGTTVIDVNGVFTFTPNPGVTGGSFTYEVSDAFGCSATGAETIIVNPSPTAANLTGNVCSNGVATGNLASAVSGGTPGYVFSLVPPAINGSATVTQAGNFTFTPSAGSTTGGFEFQATDTRGCRAFGNVDLSVNPAPTAMSGHFTGCLGGFSGTLVPLVVGVNPPFTFSGPIGNVLNGSVVINPAGTFSFTPSGLGFSSFNYEAFDSANPPCISNIAQVTVTTEPGPRASQATYNDCENMGFFVPSASGLANFVTGGMPPYTFFQTGATPACALFLQVFPDGSFVFDPATNFVGACSFNWQVEDSTPCLSNVSTGTINVHPTPVANDEGPFAACEFDPFTGDLNAFMSVGTPPYTGFTGGNPVNGMINYLLPTGPFSFTPASVGLASFQYSATDSFGCKSTTGTVSFNAAESPVITSPSPLDVCSNSSVTSVATATGSPAIQPFNFTITNVVNGTAVINATTATTATFTFTPSVTVFPTPTVQGSVTIRASAGLPSTCFSEVTVIVNIHQAPQINVTGIGSCTGNFSGSLLPYITGGVPPYLFNPVGVVPTNPTGCGTVILDVFGNFTFTANPPGSLPCPCSFTFGVTESSASHCTSTGTVAICAHQPPFANNVSTCQCANVPLTLVLSAFVTGGQPPFTFSIVGAPVGGTVLLLNATTGLVVFIPNPGFNGFASFQYQVTDSNNPPCTSNIGTVTIQVPCCPVTATS